MNNVYQNLFAKRLLNYKAPDEQEILQHARFNFTYVFTFNITCGKQPAGSGGGSSTYYVHVCILMILSIKSFPSHRIVFPFDQNTVKRTQK